jgi:hypothetical protein
MCSDGSHTLLQLDMIAACMRPGPVVIMLAINSCTALLQV